MKTSYLYVLTFLILTVFCQGVIAQDTKNMSLLGNFGKGEGESKAIFAAGSLVFYGLGNKVQIASYSDPTAPVKIGSVILPDVVEDLVRTSINGTQYLVASGGSKMWLINVQNPTTPSLVSTVDVAPGTVCEGIATSSTYAFVAAGGGGFRIYNIATPSSPTFVSSIDSLEYCESVIISGQYAYIAAGSRSHIVDISNPESPLYVGRIAGYGGYHQYINVRSGYAYICDYDNGLQIINVTNPASPTNVMTIPSGSRTARIIFDGNYGYVAVGDSGMYVYNVVNPASPAFASKIKTIGRAASLYYGAVSIGGVPTGHIFIANRNPAPGVSAINVSDPLSPTTSSFLAALPSATGSAYVPFYMDGKVYVAYGIAGLRIIDVSTPSNPTLLGTANLGGDSRDVVANGNYAYVAARDSGVYVVNITDPANPVKEYTIKTPRARGISISGNKVYVATSDSGMAYIDISNPPGLSVADYSGSSVYGENVAVDGNVAGLTDYGQITFFDITDPTAPVQKGSTSSFSTGNEGFKINGDFAYIPDGGSLKIFDITDLTNPTLASEISTGGYGYNCFVDGNYCYIASEGTGVRAINISNPSAPVEDGYYDGAPESRGVTANGGYIYVAEKIDGLSVYSNDLLTSVENENGILPESITLYQNYPNPFNPSTNIKVELNQSTFVSLKVYNSLGQKVADLAHGQLPAGVSNFTFDGSSFATGIYIYHLQANGNIIAKKMIMIK
jgi:hypothetical protein